MLALYLSLIDSEEDKDLFEKLYKEHRSTLYNYAYNILKDCQLAEDAVHETFLSLARNMDKIYNRTCIERRNYLIIIVKNASLKIYNKRKHEYVVDDIEFVDEDIGDIELNIESKDTQSQVFDMLKKLYPQYADALILKYLYDYKDKEIAKELGISLENAKIRIVRGKAKLKKLIMENGYYEK